MGAVPRVGGRAVSVGLLQAVPERAVGLCDLRKLIMSGRELSGWSRTRRRRSNVETCLNCYRAGEGQDANGDPWPVHCGDCPCCK